jgi:hypothetical protein
MPLSEQEQRLLEEMERSLYHNDADFVAGSAGRHGRPTYTMIVTGVLIGVVGVGTLIAGVAVHLPPVGVLGFILMFAGVIVALTPPRSSGSSAVPPRATTANGQTGSFPQSSNDDWKNHPDDQAE